MMDPADPDWQAFVLRMRENYDDWTGRLVFADWLDERYGDNQFSTLIRTTCEIQTAEPSNFLTPMGFIRDRQPGVHPDADKFATARSALYACAHLFPPYATLLVERPNLLAQWLFKAGFPDRLVMPFYSWLRYGHSLAAIGPIGEVIIVDAPECFIEIGPTCVQFTPMDNDLWKMTDPEHRTVVMSRRDWDADSRPHNEREWIYSDHVVQEQMNRTYWRKWVHRGFSVRQSNAGYCLDKHPGPPDVRTLRRRR